MTRNTSVQFLLSYAHILGVRLQYDQRYTCVAASLGTAETLAIAIRVSEAYHGDPVLPQCSKDMLSYAHFMGCMFMHKDAAEKKGERLQKLLFLLSIIQHSNPLVA